MNAGFKIDNLAWSRVELGLKNFATKIPDNARKTMRRAAERIVKKAKLYVPEDSGALMESIRLEANYGVRGRLEISVVVGASSSMLIDGVEVNLDQYAAIVHEAYEQMLSDGPGRGPSQKTLDKMAANPGKVGSGFLRTAYEEERKLLDRDMVLGISQIIKSEGF